LSYFVGVKTILRYLLISGSLVLTVWLMFGLQIQERSIYSHLRTLRADKAQNLLGQIRAEFESKSQSEPSKKQRTAVKKKPKSIKPKKTERQVQDLRVKKLKLAAKKVSRPVAQKIAEKAKTPGKTKVDVRISKKDEKALDDLLTARLDRLK